VVYTNPVLDPTSKMAYFKKHWPEDLQADVLACAEQVVRSTGYCIFFTTYQFLV
jgi:hypothetical protein